MNAKKSLYSRKNFYLQPVDFRIGAIVSDGMWYSFPKWRKLAKCSEEELNMWIDEKISLGELIQSSTGAKSYRFPLSSIDEWYANNGINHGSQIIDFLFPPRIWDNKTEVEGFLSAPLRTVSMVSFSSSDQECSQKIIEGLKGVAKVREVEPNQFKAYGLDATYIKNMIKNLSDNKVDKIYARAEARRRELHDFSPGFVNGLMGFYCVFGKTLVKPLMSTIEIFLPNVEDQNSQITLWVISAIEKFDEKSSVPFSGYLNSVLSRWPHDLSANHLGKDLSSFQRERSKALKKLREENNGQKIFSHEVIAEKMGISLDEFMDFEEKHQIWVKVQNASTLTWSETSEEKQVENNFSGDFTSDNMTMTDFSQANNISKAIAAAAVESGSFDEAFFLASQIDSSNVDLEKVSQLSEKFTKALVRHL